MKMKKERIKVVVEFAIEYEDEKARAAALKDLRPHQDTFTAGRDGCFSVMTKKVVGLLEEEPH